MFIRKFALTAIASAMLFSASAHAGLTANQAFQQFNAVVLTDIDSSSHLHGRTWAGGSITGGEYVHRDLPASDYAGVTVLGSISNARVLKEGAVIKGNLSNTSVNNGSTAVFGSANGGHLNGPAYVAGSISNINFNGGQIPAPNSVLQTNISASESTNFFNLLSTTSTYLSTLSNTSSVSINGNKATFTATAGTDGLAVFNLSDLEATSIFKLGEFDFALSSATTVIINAALTDIDIHANFLGGSAQKIAGNVIWNFYNAETVDLASQFGGNILAYKANLTNRADIEGSVFVEQLTQRGQIHQFAFTGDIPVAAVPEPSSYAMLFAGLVLLGAVARRRS